MMYMFVVLYVFRYLYFLVFFYDTNHYIEKKSKNSTRYSIRNSYKYYSIITKGDISKHKCMMVEICDVN